MDVYLLAIFATVANEFVLNVLAFQDSMSSASDPDVGATNLAQQWHASNEGPWLAMLSDDYELAGYQCKRVNNTGGPTEIILETGPGTFGDNSVVSGAGAVITAPYYQSSGTKPQWRRTRIFVPGIADTSVVEDKFSGPFQAAVATFITALQTPLTDGTRTWTYGAWSRVTSQFYSVTDAELSPHIGTQRRRYKPVI